MSSDEIDALLVRYLHLLDQYSSLRSEVTELQSSIHQSIARANFLAERGIRYGQDHYDSRIQAIRTLAIVYHGNIVPTFRIRDVTNVREADNDSETTELFQQESKDLNTNFERQDIDTSPAKAKVTQDENEKVIPESGNPMSVESKKPTPNMRDPLRMFGLLVPQTIRDAQSSSITMISGVIPRLVSTDAEMRDVEIEIRRARKRMAKQELHNARYVIKEVKGMDRVIGEDSKQQMLGADVESLHS